MRYKIRDYENTRYLVFTFKDGTEILARDLNNLISTIDAYNSIYHKEVNSYDKITSSGNF